MSSSSPIGAVRLRDSRVFQHRATPDAQGRPRSRIVPVVAPFGVELARHGGNDRLPKSRIGCSVQAISTDAVILDDYGYPLRVCRAQLDPDWTLPIGVSVL